MQADRYGVLRDLFWGEPLAWNHLTDGKVNFGFFANGLSWIDDGSWSIEMSMDEGSPIGRTVLRRDGWEVEFEDSLGRETFRREIRVIQAPEGARLFVNSHFNIEESDIGNTALWSPEHGAIVHYKGATWLFLRLTPSADDFACGQIGFGGYEGTRRDAEDGGLSKNAIAQGSVDAAQGLAVTSGQTVIFELTCGRTLTLPSEVQAEPHPRFGRHEYYVRSHVLNNGAVMAAGDSDIMETNRANYAYCWMRDGAHIMELLLRLGDRAAVARYLDFCDRAFEPAFRFFRQKYRLDGTPGASWHAWTKEYPFQEDETAAIVSLCAEVNEPPACTRALANALLEHIDARNDLPLPSYDLWEERYGVHTYTTATVIRGLRAAASMFPDQGFKAASDAMLSALKKRLFDQSRGVFFRSLEDPCVDSSTLHVVLMGVLEPDDPMAIANLATVEDKLWVKTSAGGLARYEEDYYFRRNFDVPGNPWIITTLWLAQSHFLAGRLEKARALLNWASARMTSTGVLPEQVDPTTGEHLSVSPLTWSHAEYLKTELMLQGSWSSLGTDLGGAADGLATPLPSTQFS